MKAFLYLNGVEPPRTHDLMKLNRLCQEYNKSFIDIIEPCSRLNPYGTQVRYPNNIEILDEDTKLAIKDIEKIKDFASIIFNI